MAAAGLGSNRVPFELARVRARAADGSWLTLFEHGRALGPIALPPSLPPRDGLEGNSVRIRLLTPLRLKARGQLAETLDFRSLAFAMLRRTLELAHFHVPGAPIDWTFRPLLDRAAAVRLTGSHLTWLDWDRYSSRQRAPMTLGGLVGSLDLQGDLAPFAPLLRAAEILHVGKGATFGLGRIAVEPLTSPAVLSQPPLDRRERSESSIP